MRNRDNYGTFGYNILFRVKKMVHFRLVYFQHISASTLNYAKVFRSKSSLGENSRDHSLGIFRLINRH